METRTAGPAPEDSGLICGWLFDSQGGAREIRLPEAGELLKGQPSRSFAWLHFNLSHMGARRWLQRQEGLPPAFLDVLGGGMTSTRIERDDRTLVAVLHDVAYDFRYNPAEIATLWVSVDRRLVITARQSPLRSVDRLRRTIAGGEAIRSSVELFEQLLRAQADVMVDVLDHLTREVDQAEDQLLAGRIRTRRATISAQRRLLVRLQRLLAPEPASLYRILQHPPGWMEEGEVQQLREASEEFSIVLQDLGSLQERVKLLQEELVALEAERTGRSLFVLTVFTVLALPINIVAGLFGMNVGGVPFANAPGGFWLVTGALVVFMAAAGWWVFRRERGWRGE